MFKRTCSRCKDEFVTKHKTVYWCNSCKNAWRRENLVLNKDTEKIYKFKKDIKMRSCLMCEDNFSSESKTNRRCPRCTEIIKHYPKGILR